MTLLEPLALIIIIWLVEIADDDMAIVFLYADDKKELGAARRSRYYMKYGNPNYGGMKGILTNSW